MELVCAGSNTFALIAVLVKLVQRSMPTYLLLEFRFGIQFLIGMTGLLYMRLQPWAASRDRKWLILWGCNYWFFTLFYYLALSRLPLGDAITLIYLGPVFGALVARLTLGDQLPKTFMPCTLLAMIGSVMVAQPSFLFSRTGREAPDFTGYMFAVIAAFLSGNIGCISRAITPGRKWLEVPTMGLGMGALLFTPVLIVVDIQYGSSAEYANVAWSPTLILLTACIGAGGFIAINLISEGFRRAEYAVASILSYSEIPFAYFLEWLVWGHKVTMLGGAGALLVVVAMAASSVLNTPSADQDQEPGGDSEVTVTFAPLPGSQADAA